MALDYVGPEIDDSEVRMSMKAKTKDTLKNWAQYASSIRKTVRNRSWKASASDPTKHKDIEDPDLEKAPEKQELEYAARASVDEVVDELDDYATTGLSHRRHSHVQGDSNMLAPSGSKHVSFLPSVMDDTTVVPTDVQPSFACSPAQTDAGLSRAPSPELSTTQVDYEGDHAHSMQPRGTDTRLAPIPESVGPSTTPSPRSQSVMHKSIAFVRTVLASILNPQALPILVALLISLVKPLKALFVVVENSPIPNAPDGQPPLAFIMDACTFIGAASVPLGLVCLGSALARMNIQLSQWRDLPIAAITWLAIGKMLVMPVLGVLITEGLVHGGIIKEEQKVLRFVCM